MKNSFAEFSIIYITPAESEGEYYIKYHQLEIASGVTLIYSFTFS